MNETIIINDKKFINSKVSKIESFKQTYTTSSKHLQKLNKDKHGQVWKYHLAFDSGPLQISSNRCIFITNKLSG